MHTNIHRVVLMVCVCFRVFAQSSGPTTTLAINTTSKIPGEPAASTQIFLEKCLPQCRQFLNGDCDQSCQCLETGLRDIKDCLQCQVENGYFDSQQTADARFDSINATCIDRGFPPVTSISNDAQVATSRKLVIWMTSFVAIALL